MTGIYKITNLATKQIYIGQTNDISRRFSEYRCPGGSHNPKLNRDFEIYGIESFSFTVLEECSQDALNARELFYIQMLSPYYNEVGKPRSEATKEKLRAAGKRQWQEMSDEEKACQISCNLKGPSKGHEVSAETREKLRQANAGKRRLKPVIIVETGEVFPGTKECAQHLGVTRNAVTCNINGKTELTRGYHIKYA